MRPPPKKSKPASTPAVAPPAGRTHFPEWLLSLVLALGTLAVYWPVTGHDFINYDDVGYVLENPHVNSGLSFENLRWAFSTGYCSNWHPVTWLSHMLDCQMFGLKPRGHHLVNLLLHGLNTVLVFRLLRGLTGAVWRSLLVAALFGLHPAHVESVAWVAERKDVLSGCFGLLALIFYGRYAQKRAALDYAFALFFFALGLMSKPMLVTWPLVMLLLDFWPLNRMQAGRIGALVVEKIPFFALAAAASIVTFMVQSQSGAVAELNGLPLGVRVPNALISYCRYLGELFWPHDLAVFYPYNGAWPFPLVLLAGGFLAGLSVLLFTWWRAYPDLLMGWLWFIGTLVPVIGLVQVGKQSMADRYTYLPSLGVFIFVIWGAYELIRRQRQLLILSSVAAFAAIVLCSVVTRQQLTYWQDSETLFRHALAVTSNNTVAHNNLGNTFLKARRTTDAISQYQEALRLWPDDPDAHNDLGMAFLQNHQIDEAITECQAALRLRPDEPKFFRNLGIALYQQGQNDEAISRFQQALRLMPDDAATHFQLGLAFDKKRQTDEAIREYLEAIRLQPNGPEARHSLGVALFGKGEINDAISQFQAVVRLQPDDADAHFNLGVALLQGGQPIDSAIEQFQKAAGLKPDNSTYHFNLGVALLKQGRVDEGIHQYQEAIRISPDDADMHNNLGNAFVQHGQADQAISQYREAIRINPDDANTHFNLGVALYGKGQITGAISELQATLRLQPDHLDAKNDLEVALARQRKSNGQTNAP
jgi:tetratricopeptide (TPR) repeat protein